MTPHPGPAPSPVPAATPGSAAAPTPPSRARARATNAAIVIACFVSAALAAASVDPRMRGATPGESGSSLAVFSFFTSIAAGVALCWRYRSPTWLVATTLAACVPPLALPTDSLAALIGAASVIVHHRDVRVPVGVTTAAAIATAVAVWRDSRGTRSGTSFWNVFEHPDGSAGTWPPMPWWQVLLVTTALVGVTVGVALIRRGRRDVTTAQASARQARATAHEARIQVDDLGRRVAEQDEREALAREVHDVLGHRLSILAMQANALEIEADAAGAPEVRARARQIQEGASGSMSDLRSLLAMMRTGRRDAAHEHADLADIADLVRECIDAGTPVSSTVFVDQSRPLDPVISRSAYRITTELLTNARKHAPGALVYLDIRGDPARGITITTQNPLPNRARSGDGGTGLTGVARRCEDIGGSFGAGPSHDGRQFVASATLPWTRAQRR